MSSEDSEQGQGGSPLGAVIPEEGSPMRTLVVRLGEVESSAHSTALARRRGHEVRETRSPEECYWLVATGSVDLLLVALDAEHLAEAADLVGRVREEPFADAMHTMALLEGANSAGAGRLIEDGIDDFLYWPEDSALIDLRIRLAEVSLGRRESTYRETQDLRQAEERFENVFHESPDAVLIVSNEDGRILEANRRVESILGYRRGVLKGRFMAVLFPELFQNVSGVLSAQPWVAQRQAPEVAYRRPQAEVCHLELEAMLVPWGRAREELMVIISDVTLRRELERERIKSSKAESIRLLAGGVAHDFNNILTAICGNLGLIGQHAFLPPDSRRLLNSAEASCERARSLSEQLAMFAREGELAAGLRELSGLLRKGVHFALYGGKARPEFHLPLDLWPVYCDEGQILQVIANLTINADQAMTERGGVGRLQITGMNVTVPEGTRLPLTPGDYVRVSFRDEGPGIAMEDIHRIFDPYFSTRAGLSGLGLATISTVIKNHRGYLRAESVEGEGALFEFYLPALSDPTILKSDAEPEGPPTATRVLFMDDEDDIREIVDKILTRHGFDVYCAADGREAIEVYEKSLDFGEPFDVLLFDLDVRGGLGGREAIQHLRQRYPYVKALVTSGYSDDKILENHREAGFSGVLTKPFRIEKLVTAVTQMAQQGKKSKA
ncbi:MAG: response regulator [Verrucomicrobiales bacterium]